MIGCGTSLYMAQCYAALREQAGHGMTDAFPASEHALRPRLRPGAGDQPLRHHHRGAASVLRELPPGPAVTAITADGARADRRAGRSRWCCSTTWTSGRWCRPGSPPRTLALLRAHLGEDLAPVAEQARAALRRRAGRRAARRRAGQLPRPRLDGRAGPRGGAQAARGGPAVDRVVPGDGVPARPDQHRRAGPGDLGVRRRSGRAGRARCGHRRALRAPRRPTRWPTWSGCTGCAWSPPAARGLDPDRPRHLSRSIILTP